MRIRLDALFLQRTEYTEGIICLDICWLFKSKEKRFGVKKHPKSEKKKKEAKKAVIFLLENMDVPT